MFRNFKHRHEDVSKGPKPADGAQQSRGSGRPAPVLVAAILCGPIVVVAVPALWHSGYTLLQAVLLTSIVQALAIILGAAFAFYRAPCRPGHEGVATEVMPETTDPSMSIWRSYSGNRLQSNPHRVALIAEDSVQGRQIAMDLARHGYDVHHTTDAEAMFETVRTARDIWDFVIFDLDLGDDLEANVEELVSFRLDCASIPVLLLSGCVSRDELSEHRRAIGDVTLRKPVFRTRLLDGIEDMKANWRSRKFS